MQNEKGNTQGQVPSNPVQAGQGITNGMKVYTDHAVDAACNMLGMIVSTGGNLMKSIEVTRHVAKEATRNIIDENMGGRSGPEQTEHLASLPPVQPLIDPREVNASTNPTLTNLLSNLGKDE